LCFGANFSLDERNKNVTRAFDWLFVCEPTTTVNLDHLITLLHGYNPDEEHFIGRALTDAKATIIHHYYGFAESDQQILYPETAAGFLISRRLLHRIVSVLPNETTRGFAIDPKHEVHNFVSRHFSSALYELVLKLINYVFIIVMCKHSVSENDILYAVKTYSGYHNTRIVVVKRTWAITVKHIQYFSDINDTFVPTISLGVNNTVRGHCGKTEAIFNYFVRSSKFNNMKWLVIADDDTLLSTKRLHKLLECYSSDESLILGERYGYGFDADGLYGYDYPTGGAGMVFSHKAVKLLTAKCRCPSIDSPDDMIIGWCAREQKIPIIHSASFHQAQPEDYSTLYLKRLLPISFHKFENIDPYSVYVERLDDYHDSLRSTTAVHEEL
uniref:N-acetylgalactosaminide beta-1,3-galactosyltransferase n=1 Tax=Syphacia muris TaxID=451379 RepID=A0A0N5APQ5_9BILA